jgi:hypothetical protein
MTSGRHLFKSIQWFDPTTSITVRELYWEELETVSIPHNFATLANNLQPDEQREVQAEELDYILTRFHDAKLVQHFPARLVCELSELPYRVHGGREYDLMYRGIKPLAAFPCPPPSSPLASFLEKYFGKSVDSGKLCQKTIYEIEEGGEKVPREQLYSQPSETWRFNFYGLMRSISKKTRWNDSLEYIQGYLLGYSSEQNDIWYEYRKRKGIKWGAQLVYALIEEPDQIQRLESVGGKAFADGDDHHLRIFLPHFGPELSVVEAALRTAACKLAKFFAPQLYLVDFYKETTEIGNVKFEVYCVPGEKKPELNSKIEGTIEII